MKIYYKGQQNPGCGGCLLVMLVIALLTGGISGIIKFIGTLFYIAIFLVLIVIGAVLFLRWNLKKNMEQHGREGYFGNFNKRYSDSQWQHYEKDYKNYRNNGFNNFGNSVNGAERHYAILELQPGATAAEIKKAYRTLSMQYHPDKVRNRSKDFQDKAEEKMKDINAAYTYFEQNGYL